MDIRQLECFVAVAEELHFRRAGERLGLSQSALSERISALEHEIGAPLFFRTTRQVNLTQMGADFLNDAKRILSDVDKTSTYRQRLLSKAPQNKICGISYKSQNEAIGKYKAIELTKLKEILEIPGITFVNLQYNPPTEEIELFQSIHKVSIKNFNEVELQETQKIVFTLHKVDGKSYKEISEIIEKSISSVESLMFRAKINLQKQLEYFYKNKN